MNQPAPVTPSDEMLTGTYDAAFESVLADRPKAKPGVAHAEGLRAVYHAGQRNDTHVRPA